MARALRYSPDRSARCYVAAPMTLKDLELLHYFLRRVVAQGDDEELLFDLVEKIEKEIRRCKTTSK